MGAACRRVVAQIHRPPRNLAGWYEPSAAFVITVRIVERPTIKKLMCPLRHNDPMFSLGGLIGRFWRPRRQWMPWTAAAAGLAIAGLYDLLTVGRGPDFILLGLAAYELLVGLTNDPRKPPPDKAGP
jgi:hypothetical protein